jgi:hypothetical protein
VPQAVSGELAAPWVPAFAGMTGLLRDLNQIPSPFAVATHVNMIAAFAGIRKVNNLETCQRTRKSLDKIFLP